MGVFFDLFSSGISALFYGFLLAVAITAGLFLILKAFCGTPSRPLPVAASFALLFVVALVNMSVMMGAFKIKGITADAIELLEYAERRVDSFDMGDFLGDLAGGDYAQMIADGMELADGTELARASELMDELKDNGRLLQYYFQQNDMSTLSLVLSPIQTLQKFNDKMNSAIWHSILWTLAFMALAAIVMVRSQPKPRSSAGFYDGTSIGGGNPGGGCDLNF